jgi:hypothetical protein
MADSRGQRAQLFVVGALALAVLVIGVALLLNSGIYGANLSAQQVDGSVDEPREVMREAQLGLNGVLEFSNYNNDSSHGTIKQNLTKGARNWSTAAQRHQATTGTGINVSSVTVNNGTRIDQDFDGDFTNRDGDTEWYLNGPHPTRPGFDEVRQFRINVSQSSLVNQGSLTSPGVSNNAFTIRVHPESSVLPTPSPVRNIRIYDHTSPDRIGVLVDDGTDELATCTAPVNFEGRATIYLSAAHVGTDDCDALDFFDAPWLSPYKIEYRNAGQVEGVYELFAENRTEMGSLRDPPVPSGTPQYYFDDGGGDPYIAPAVYNASADISYTTQRTSVRGNVSVEPEGRASGWVPEGAGLRPLRRGVVGSTTGASCADPTAPVGATGNSGKYEFTISNPNPAAGPACDFTIVGIGINETTEPTAARADAKNPGDRILTDSSGTQLETSPIQIDSSNPGSATIENLDVTVTIAEGNSETFEFERFLTATGGNVNMNNEDVRITLAFADGSTATYELCDGACTF